MSGRVVPVPDERSAAYWDAAREHQLTMARCGNCGRFTLPPDVMCPHCHTTEPDYRFEPVEGGATVRSWTVIRRSFLPGFDIPYVLVDGELDAQPDLRMIGRLLDGPEAPLKLGDRLVVEFEDLDDEFSVPAFRLDPAGAGTDR